MEKTTDERLHLHFLPTPHIPNLKYGKTYIRQPFILLLAQS